MFDAYKYKEWFSWPLVRAHLCTLAVSLSFNATWRVPREAFRYGGVSYGVLLTSALVIVALPVTLLQLAIGQLSQQDAVGVWRAVPFFKGVGYLRVLVSFIWSSYTVVYLSLTIAYFLYSATNSIPFPNCIEIIIVEEEYFEIPLNATECLRNTFLTPVAESPEYYLATAFISVVIWISGSCVFFNTVKLMKRFFYVIPILIIIPGVVVVSSIGDKSFLSHILNEGDWNNVSQPYIWQSAVVQALMSTQIAGGYLISAGDSIYSNTNVQWTSIAMIMSNIITNWFWLIFWFGVSGDGDEDLTPAAVLLQTYKLANKLQVISIAWPLIIFIALILSGVISTLALLYPMFDRLRRVGGVRWRIAASVVTLCGAATSLGVLVGGLPIITLADDVTVPLLISTATVMEIFMFGFIYGWKTLIEDVEFLTGTELNKLWVWGWWLAPAVIVTFTAWWIADIFATEFDWAEDWEASTVLATALVMIVIIAICACIAVARQVQYDIIGKLKSSFQPSRHWGPRDPITHYYWLARREEGDRSQPRTRYNRRELGQLSTRPSFLTVSECTSKAQLDLNKRSNSDDWLYTFGRKLHLSDGSSEIKRSKSLDWDFPAKKQSKLSVESILSSSNESNNNIHRF